MPILLNCPKCQKKLRVGDEARGQQAQCPQCSTVFTVGGAAPPSPLTVKPAGEDEGEAVGLAERICPGCNENLARDAVVCVRCGFDLRAGKKLETVKERKRGPARRIERLWDGDIPLQTRGIVCGAVVAAVLFVAVLIASQEQVVGAFAVLILFVPMLLLAFGTFTRTQLISSSREDPVIKLTKWFCFFPFEKKTVHPRKYDKLDIEHTGESGDTLGIFVLLLLCACGLIPALVYYLAFSGRFQLSLIAEGWEPVVVYRGQSQTRMREMADAIEEASGLHLA